MLLTTKDLITKTTARLLKKRQTILSRPGMALIWVGNDAQTRSFVRVKQQKAKLLDCEFFLHHLESATLDQLVALMHGLNRKKEVHGIVLQLPLPNKSWTDQLIELMNPLKDIDHLRSDSPFAAPTPSGILEILRYNKIDLKKERTAILGAGRLVGAPLADIFQNKRWPFIQIPRRASENTDQIKQCTVLISGTGVNKLVSKEMVTREMIVVDGSGVDVDTASVESIVRGVTPSKGSVGPMTVCCLFDNLLTAASE